MIKYLLALVLLAPAISFAQSNYKPGDVVTAKGDTVAGFINYKEWDKNPYTITFQNSLQGQKVEYSSKNIAAFTVTGYEKYRSFNMRLSQDYIDHERLNPWLDTVKKADTVFLRTITAGKYLTLFSFKDKIKQRFFISNGGSKPVELVYHVYLDTVYQTEVHTIETYKIQLQKLIAAYKPGDQKLVDEVQRTIYNEGSLSEIVYNINGTSGQQMNVARNKPDFFAGVSVNSFSNSLQITNGVSATTKASAVIYPGIDVGLDIYSNKIVGRWLFRLELSAVPNKVNVSYQQAESSVSINGYNLKFNQFTTAFVPQLIYNIYNGQNLKFYLDAGLAIGDNMYSSKQATITFKYITSGEVSSETVDPPSLQFLYFNVPVKAGILLNKNIDIYVGFNPRTKFDDDTTYQLNEESFCAGINYVFGK
jgi:hypothetical protein